MAKAATLGSKLGCATTGSEAGSQRVRVYAEREGACIPATAATLSRQCGALPGAQTDLRPPHTCRLPCHAAEHRTRLSRSATLPCLRPQGTIAYRPIWLPGCDHVYPGCNPMHPCLRPQDTLAYRLASRLAGILPGEKSRPSACYSGFVAGDGETQGPPEPTQGPPEPASSQASPCPPWFVLCCFCYS